MSEACDKNRSVQGCEKCPAMCCYGIEQAVPAPKTLLDEQNMLWQLHFVNTKFFIRNGRWYTLSLGPCRYLNEENLCTIYDKRPDVCREHMPPDCEFYFKIFDTMFDRPEKLRLYFKRRRDKRKKAKSKSR